MYIIGSKSLFLAMVKWFEIKGLRLDFEGAVVFINWRDELDHTQ